MFDHALRLRDEVREELLRTFPALRCFVRIAPVNSPWLLVSDAPRHFAPEALRQTVSAWGLPFVIEDGLLQLDAPDCDYEQALMLRPSPQTGPYLAAYARLQATAALLLRHPVDAMAWGQARPLVRKAWRAFALGETQTRRWTEDMRATLACGLREKQTSGLYACGVLLAAWMEQRGIPIPWECPEKWEE